MAGMGSEQCVLEKRHQAIVLPHFPEGFFQRFFE